jgi:hypothetical protein
VDDQKAAVVPYRIIYSIADLYDTSREEPEMISHNTIKSNTDSFSHDDVPLKDSSFCNEKLEKLISFPKASTKIAFKVYIKCNSESF